MPGDHLPYRPILSHSSLTTAVLLVARTAVQFHPDATCVRRVVVFFRFIQGIQVMGLSYGVIMVIFLGALVPAVANRNFQHQSKER